MKIALSNFSIVVLAQAHNPTILNPDFLRNNQIVSEAWTPKTVICTQPVAQVVYEEGISIVAEFERLQFVDTVVNRIPETSPLPEIAIGYIQTLPHVRYKAVGLNFSGSRVFENRWAASSFISKRFIKSGPWLPPGETTEIGLTFGSSIEGIKRSITLKPGTISRPEGELSNGILVNANYHLDIREGDVDSLKSFILGWQALFAHLQEFTNVVFGEE